MLLAVLLVVGGMNSSPKTDLLFSPAANKSCGLPLLTDRTTIGLY